MVLENKKRLRQRVGQVESVPYSLSETEKLSNLRGIITELYKDVDLSFHDLFHVSYVAEKARFFADEYNRTLRRNHKRLLNLDRMEALGLVHDLNYLVDRHSRYASAGAELRQQVLSQAGYTESEIEEIERIVNEADFQRRTLQTNPSIEAKILSDADTAFKVDPVAHTHVAPKGGYAKEQNIEDKELSRKIVEQQGPYIRLGIFFYTPTARKIYQPLAEADLRRHEQKLSEEE